MVAARAMQSNLADGIVLRHVVMVKHVELQHLVLKLVVIHLQPQALKMACGSVAVAKTAHLKAAVKVEIGIERLLDDWGSFAFLVQLELDVV